MSLPAYDTSVIGLLLQGKYRVGTTVLGSGGCGKVYLGVNVETSETVAVKFDRPKGKAGWVAREAKVYEYIHGLVGCPGVPRVLAHGQEREHAFLVMERLGRSLEQVLDSQLYRQLEEEVVFGYARQMITCLENVHKRRYLHMDVKPLNFLLGFGSESRKVFLVDFGHARAYVNSVTGQHVEYCQGRDLASTPKFASTNLLMGGEASRRDDMESLGYVIIYLLQGSLPWLTSSSNLTMKERIDWIRERRIAISLESLCDGVPNEVALYLKHCKGLSFTQAPDYAYLRRMFDTRAAIPQSWRKCH